MGVGYCAERTGKAKAVLLSTPDPVSTGMGDLIVFQLLVIMFKMLKNYTCRN